MHKNQEIINILKFQLLLILLLTSKITFFFTYFKKLIFILG